MSQLSSMALRDKRYLGIAIPVTIALLGTWYKRRHPSDSWEEDLILGASPPTRNCLWDNTSFEAKYPRKDSLYCSAAHTKLGKTTLKWNLAGRSGRSGISGDTLGKMMRVLKDKGAGIGYTSGGWLEALHDTYKVSSRRLHPSGVARLMKIYLRDDVLEVTKEKGKTVYKWKKGNSLKDWLKPKYVTYLETNFSAEDEDADPDEITERPQKGSGPHYCDVCGYNYGREIMIKDRDPKPTTTCLCEIKARAQRKEDESKPGEFRHRMKTLREEGGLATSFYDEEKPTSYEGDYPAEEPKGVIGASRRKENWPPHTGIHIYDNIGEQMTFWRVPNYKTQCLHCGGSQGGLHSLDDGKWICKDCKHENEIAWWVIFGGVKPFGWKPFRAEGDAYPETLEEQIAQVRFNIQNWQNGMANLDDTADSEEKAYVMGGIQGMSDVLAGLENVGLELTLEEAYTSLIPRARGKLQEARTGGEALDIYYMEGVLEGYKMVLKYLSQYPPSWSVEMAAEDASSEVEGLLIEAARQQYEFDKDTIDFAETYPHLIQPNGSVTFEDYMTTWQPVMQQYRIAQIVGIPATQVKEIAENMGFGSKAREDLMNAEDIETYRGKRKAPTPEPGAPGTTKKSTGPPMKVQGVDVYSIQEHHAEKRGAHRDIRIGYDDPTHGPVLLSFVPTGGLDNKIPTKVGRNHKITTIKTEDHPFDYWYFEGNIPAGSYGAGPVSLETYGNCKILAYEPGKKLKVEFTGGKYPGKYVFIHYRGKVWGMWRYE